MLLGALSKSLFNTVRLGALSISSQSLSRCSTPISRDKWNFFSPNPPEVPNTLPGPAFNLAEHKHCLWQPKAAEGLCVWHVLAVSCDLNYPEVVRAALYIRVFWRGPREGLKLEGLHPSRTKPHHPLSRSKDSCLMAELHLVVQVKDLRLWVQKSPQQCITKARRSFLGLWLCVCGALAASLQHWTLDLCVQVSAGDGGVGRKGDLQQFPIWLLIERHDPSWWIVLKNMKPSSPCWGRKNVPAARLLNQAAPAVWSAAAGILAKEDTTLTPGEKVLQH